MAHGLRVRLVQFASATLAVALCAVFGLHLLDRPGIYYARTVMIIYPPDVEGPDNPLDRRIQAAISFVGLAARKVGGISGPSVNVSGRITLLDQNVRKGTSIRQTSKGGQWDLIFDQPAIEVQATGSSAQEVKDRVSELAASVEAEVVASQDHLGVSESNRLRTLRSPDVVQVNYAQGSRIRAAVALIGVGAVLAVGAFNLSGALFRRHRWGRPAPRSD